MEIGRTFALVLDLVERKEVMISDHGYDELAEDAILVKDILASVSKGMVVLDDMRDALCRGDVREAAQLADVFLTPAAVNS
jgi:hypothetical protein